MEKNTIELMDYLRVIWKMKYMIIIGTLVCVILAGAASFLLPEIYQASVTFMVSEPKMAEVSNLRTAPYFIKYPIKTYEGIIKNRSLIAKIIEKFKLDVAPYEMTLDDLNENIIVESSSDSKLIILKVEFPDPDLAQQIANELALLAINLNKTLTEKEAVDSRDLIKSQLEGARLKLDQAERALLDFQRTSQIESLKKELEIQFAQKRTLEIALADTEIALAENKARLQKIEEQFKTQYTTLKPVSNMIEDLAHQQSLATLSRADIKELLGFNVERESQNPIYFHLENQLVDIASSICSLFAQKAYLEASLKENAIKLKRLQDELAQKEIELTRLTRERDLAQDIHTIIIRYDEARIQVVSDIPALKIIEHATLPQKAIKPKKKLITGIAGMAGFLFFVLISFTINFITTVCKQY